MATTGSDVGHAAMSVRVRSNGINRGIAAMATLFVLWLVLIVTLAQHDVRTSLAPALLGIDGTGGLQPAAQTLIAGETSPTAIANARAVAIRTLRYEPTNVQASRLLALTDALSGNVPASLTAFEYTELLSRRDIPTEFALVEVHVNRGDIPGALLHYDRAMRTSAPARTTLVPVLSAAANNPTISRGLRPFLARRPDWIRDYLPVAIRTASNPESLFLQADGTRLDPAIPTDRSLLSDAMSNLLRLNRPDLAWRLYVKATGSHGTSGTLRNGSFEGTNPIPPFDWGLADTPDLSPSIEPVEGAMGSALLLNASQSGELARETLLLRPGSHRLTARVGAIPSDTDAQPIITIRCSDGALIMQHTLPTGNARVDWSFIRPDEDGCRSQTIVLLTGSTPDPQQHPWIDDVAIVTDKGR